MTTSPSGAEGGLAIGSLDPKSDLMHFCQRFCQRPVTKDDIVYTWTRVESEFQAVVTLNCLGGLQYAGELQANARLAEKAAALQALEAHSEDAAKLPPAKSAGTKKRKPPDGWTGMPMSAEMLNSIGGLSEEVMAAVERAAKQSRGGGSAEASQPNAAVTAKVQLNAAAMRIARRALTKGDTVYETQKTTGGFQATVRLPCLPGEWSSAIWAGEESSSKQAAEQSAAAMALETIFADETLSSTASAPRPKPNSGRGYGKGFGKGKGKGKEYSGMSMPMGGKGFYAWDALAAMGAHQAQMAGLM
eukprot:CAMPEP_0170606086 /NCGR_PEP_ID=MMETSP0224-20130122/20319_1 /TAXON_ID=285029 /ORGANISM="Togula jolla, Strain CCCM 725" /LENGTH=302 /DNA_ID=CAMNT_0010931133 /DNA_START=24 /DNA_END=932 /DNA_ORIENTATION=+